MIRNFVAGALWGGVVAGLGLGVISQVTPMPGADVVPTVAATPEAAVEVPAADTAVIAPEIDTAMTAPKVDAALIAPKADAASAPAQDMGADPVAGGEPAPADQIEGAPVEGGQIDAGQGGAAVAAAPGSDPAPAPDGGGAAQTIEAAPSESAEPPLAVTDAHAAPTPLAEGEAPAVGVLVDVNPPSRAPEALPPVAVAEAAPGQSDLPPPVVQPAEPLLDAMPAPVPAPAPGLIVMDAAPAADQPAADQPADASPTTLTPEAALDSDVAGVTIGRLPRIGTEPVAIEPAPAADPGTDPAALPILADDAPPILRFARPFQNESGKPLFALILRDTGAPDLDRARLAALPFPVSFVVDPLSDTAAEAATIYRAAGQEVLMLASGIPDGAQASDLEQTFQSHAATLPDAVAVIDMGTAGFQDNRPLATQVVPLIKAQGRGLITYDRGLNAADQVARRDDVPSATIFRQLDVEGEDIPLIRRYLDRAAFKAAQEGRVIVLGETRPETIAALMEWTVEGRASSVTLAPVTAVMAVQ